MPEFRADLQGSLSDGFSPSAALLRQRTSALPSISALRHKSFRLGSTEPGLAIVLKELLGPAVSVTCLVICALTTGQALTPSILALGLIAFFVSGTILSKPRIGAPQELQLTLTRVLLEWSLVVGVMALLVALLPLSHAVRGTTLDGWFVVTPVALLLADYGAVSWSRWWQSRQPPRMRHVIIGATDVGLELARRIEQSLAIDGTTVGFFDFRARARLPALGSGQWLGSCSDPGGCRRVAEYVHQRGIDAVYIALPVSNAPRIAELLHALRDTTASIYFVPDLLGFDLVQPRCLEVQGVPALAVCESPFVGVSGLRKRAVDLLLVLATLPITAPVMCAIALAVKLSTRGPALFMQRRYGLHGEEIHVYKFRTMTCCEDGDVVPQATREDPRVTRIGRVLRRLSLDELPQLLNVLQGTMSLVGPRPHAVAHNEQYRQLISGYMLRHKIRPGITGWAQVNGLRGETDTLEKMRTRIAYDIDYLKNWSLWLDVKILLRTCLVLFRDDRAY